MTMLHKTTCMLLRLLLIPLLATGGAADTEIASPIPFTIHTHGVALTEEDISSVLDAAHKILATNGVNISFDVSHSFDSNHKVIDDGKVNGCSDLRALLRNGDVNVHIVDDIPCCSTVQQKGIVGCSGLNMAIIALPGNHSMDPKTLKLRAIRWIHNSDTIKGLAILVSRPES